ncbi:MAG: radical SAM protein [Oscillospiraceae bacterium]|jgi:tRNA A37 methylthiotransferase MiaB|nr:radical SAM protein [Oscillospiraceae bacterium]
MKICIVSSIGEQTYQGKYAERKLQWSPFWDLALFRENSPIDAVDYYQISRTGTLSPNPNRHIYTIGILISNHLKTPSNKIVIMNSFDDNYSFDDVDVVIISTTHGTTNWEYRLIDILKKLKSKGIKSIIGGIGIKKLYLRNIQIFSSILSLATGYIIISDNGLSKLSWAVDNIHICYGCEIIEIEDKYILSCDDFSLKDIDESLHSKHTVLITQTGCVYDCAFCGYKDKYKSHSFFDLSEIKKTLVTMSKTNKQGLNHLRFADETFNVDNERVINLCEFIKTQNFDFHWSCFLRADNISLELIKALSASKCDFVSIGVESGSTFMQGIMNKNIDLNKLKQSISELQNAGIIVNISLMVGFLGETDLTIKETMNYIASCKSDLARVNVWTPARNEKNQSLFNEYDFQNENDTWFHKSLSESQAINFAKEIYMMDESTIFIPPFSSIFDQWPVLSSYGLSKEEILRVFRNYYIESKTVEKSKLKRRVVNNESNE